MARIRSAVAGMAFVALGYFSFLNYIAGDEEEIVFSDVTVHLPGSTHKSESSTSGITRRDTQGLVSTRTESRRDSSTSSSTGIVYFY